MSKNNSPTIQAKLDQLTTLLAWFDGDDFVLEQAPARFAEVATLAEAIDADLAGLKNEINVLKVSFEEAA